MKKGISSIVGQTTDAEGESIPLYRAERSLTCSACGADIPAGEIFTRRAPDGQRLRIYAQCRKCAPLSQDEKKDSGMIQMLLSPEGQSAPAPSSNSEARQRTIAQEVERRLGPALRYSRRKRT